MDKYLKLLGFAGFLLALTAFAQGESFKMNEESLFNLAQKGAPGLDQIEAAFNLSKAQEGEAQDAYTPELFGKGSYSETNEKALLAFIPVYTPVKQAQIGLRQNLKYGLTGTAAVTTDQRTGQTNLSGKLQNLTTTSVSFSLQMDLWKDLLGRMSLASLENANLEAKKAQIEKEIQTKTFSVSIRRLYWSLVANQEALKISGELLKTAQKQEKEISQRFKNSVAEADELARYRAQVASREGTIFYLEYQKETYLKQLKNLLPELNKKEIELTGYDLNRTLDNVLECTSLIANEKKTPFHFTQYDEAVELIRKMKSNSKIKNSRYSDIDLKAFATVKSIGVGSEATQARLTRGSYGSSFEDMEQNNRTGYEVGVSFTLPLGEQKENTKKSKEIYDEKRLLASINSSEAKVENTHQELIKSVTLLAKVIGTQRRNTEELEKRLKFMRKKYEQARVSVNDLINDQDSLLSAELNKIDTELQILNTLFDYLIVFTETPCSFNRI